jgi:hypothetical protein
MQRSVYCFARIDQHLISEITEKEYFITLIFQDSFVLLFLAQIFCITGSCLLLPDENYVVKT